MNRRAGRGDGSDMGQGSVADEAFEERIGAALGRIRSVVTAWPGPATVSAVEAGPDPRVAVLQAALDDERTVTAQLEERVRLLKDRQDTRLAQLEAALQAERARLAGFDADLQALRAANAELNAMVTALRDAVAREVAEPDLVNRAILAELEAVKALRATDRAEIDAVLAALEPILAEET